MKSADLENVIGTLVVLLLLFKFTIWNVCKLKTVLPNTKVNVISKKRIGLLRSDVHKIFK